MTRPALLALALLTAACGVRSRTDLRWIGPVIPIAPAPGCSPSTGVLTIRDTDVVFAPDEGTWLLYGTAKPGALSAAASRIGADKKLYETTLDASWTDTEVNGTYKTPRCTYKVALARR